MKKRVSLAVGALTVAIALGGLALGLQSSSPASGEVPEVDTDGDGCSDLEELGDNPNLGGARRPNHRWDFYDVTGDRTVDLFSDILGVAFLFGAAAPGPPYEASFDRSAPKNGMDPWDMEEPDGVIDLFNDILGVAFQFGHTCDGKADFPDILKFLTGMESLEELEQFIEVDIPPVIDVLVASTEGGATISSGQQLPGGYTIVCVSEEGIALAPPSMPTPDPSTTLLPGASSDVPEEVYDDAEC